ncbi:MAG TPA: hypothetical protein VM120_03115 [Bryobacteraceae bacterium]|nr:hypothetical protein [Bryobacteraceae bacterium]
MWPAPLTVDDQGNAIYNVLALNPADPWGRQGSDIAGAWLVKVTPQGVSAAAKYKTLIPDAAPTQCRRRRPGRVRTCAPTQQNPHDNRRITELADGTGSITPRWCFDADR